MATRTVEGALSPLRKILRNLQRVERERGEEDREH